MFACCCGPRARKEVTSDSAIVDVEKLLQDYVWQDFVDSLHGVQRWCVSRSRQNYVVEVPLNYFHVEEFKRPKMTSRVLKSESDKRVALDSKSGGGGGGRKKKKKKEKSGACADSNKSELVTNYVNDTGTEQTYKFRLEKTRKSTLNVTVQKGFSIGSKTNFTLGLPKLAGRSRREGVFFL